MSAPRALSLASASCRWPRLGRKLMILEESGHQRCPVVKVWLVSVIEFGWTKRHYATETLVDGAVVSMVKLVECWRSCLRRGTGRAERDPRKLVREERDYDTTLPLFNAELSHFRIVRRGTGRAERDPRKLVREERDYDTTLPLFNAELSHVRIVRRGTGGDLDPRRWVGNKGDCT